MIEQNRAAMLYDQQVGVSTEQTTARVQAWLANQSDELAISDWTALEFGSAVAVKRRAGELTMARHAEALKWFETFRGEAAELWSVRAAAFRRAMELINLLGVKVRAADALHLAIAEERVAILCTLDNEQADAGAAAGIAAKLL